MSLKSLFGKEQKKLNVQPLVNFFDKLEDVESIGYIDQFLKERRRFKSHTDFYTGSNFCVFGSLQEYYQAGIDRVINTYPYDGSLKEKLQWINDSSGFDLHLFENEYPRTNGYISISDNRPGGDGWGSVVSTSGSYGNPASKEYIYIKGGPNIGNVYNTASHQNSNLEINGRTGNTVEFWLKKSEFVSAKTNREVVLDVVTTGSTEGQASYGRLTVELDSTDSSVSPFIVTFQSGTTGVKNRRIGSTHLYSSASDDSWHHYAFTFKNHEDKVKLDLYVDGEHNKTDLVGSSVGALNTPLVGTIGSLAAGKSNNEITKTASEDFIPGLGYGKLSGSLDEFRYWKKQRTHKQIGRFWFTSVGAGSNTDPSNTSLGVYYKFNEGKVGAVKKDKTILDYGGRVSNGLWVGYEGYGRYNNSAMVEASASLSEFKDPILYKEHPLVSSFIQTSIEKGYAYDLENPSGIYHSFPSWIVDEDGEASQDLKKISQIMASYFDSLFLQIRELSSLRHTQYSDFDKKPYPFNSTRLESMGLVTPELFMDASNLNFLMNRDEDKEFKQATSDVKNFIYNNIYNNLEMIVKSKGTEKSFRNLFRCFGIDSDLVKINLYSTDSEYPIDDSYRTTTTKTKYVNFSNQINSKASVFQTIDGLSGLYRLSDARGYMTGSEDVLDDDSAVSTGLTVEAQLHFPKLYPLNHPFHFETDISSSLLGCYSVIQKSTGQDGSDVSWRRSADDKSNFQLFAVKEKRNSKTAKFVLKSRNNLFDPIETSFIKNIYDINRWNVAVKLLSDTTPGLVLSGSSGGYKIGLFCANAIGDHIEESYFVTGSITENNAKNFIKNSRRFYIGANRQDFTGDLLYRSDVKVANFRVWNKALENSELESHTIDPESYGLESPSRLSFPIADIGNSQVPGIDLLAINWNFSSLTGSNQNGEMWINDVSSGSLEDDKSYGKLSPILRRLHPAKGINFAPSTTSSVDVEYDAASRLQEFENVGSLDMVKVSLNDDIIFTRETRPTDYFFSFEKSMYSTISDEILNFFAGVSEFSSLFGAPVERYRPQYKGLNKLRRIFFSRIQNAPDIERYTEYYKWIDSSLSVMIDQLVPASVASSEDIRNVIQSHVLERSKYYNKFPTMEFKQSEPEANIRGINELLYDWEHGHAPIGKQGEDNVHCLWTRERAQRRTDLHVTSSGNSVLVEAVDKDREVIRRVAITSVSGSTYATRRLSRPYNLTTVNQGHFKGGDNAFGNRKKRFFTGVSTAHGLSHIAVTGSESTVTPCEDKVAPHKKKRIRAAADIAFTGKDRDINDVAPFAIYSSSLDPVSGYQKVLFEGYKKGVDITNLHTDEYGDDREVTLQSPFTERWVGGNQHRHQDLSGSLFAPIEAKKDGKSRLEAFKLLAQDEKLYVLPPNATSIDNSNLPVIDHNIQHAQMLREEVAKRPVNIRNIATTTGSISLGNYNHIYDVVQYTTEDQRKDFLVDNLEQMTSSASAIPGVQEFSKFYRPPRKSVFKARFAAPGGTEVAGDSRGGHSIDRETNQYSVYNSLNYRNLSVRGPLDFLSKTPQTASTDSNSLVTNHKVNSNPRYRRRIDGGMYNGEVDLNQDNAFVTHQIPRNDYQYGWITASLATGRSPVEIAGHLHSFTQASLGETTGSMRYEKTYEFLTASGGRNGEALIDFVGINKDLEFELNTDINTVSQRLIALKTVSFNSSASNELPSGWTSNQSDEAVASGPVVKENSQDSSSKILALIGEQDAHNNGLGLYLPTTTSDYFRWVEYEEGFDIPTGFVLDVSFEYIVGSDSPGLSQNYGLTNNPEKGENLYLQSKVGSGGTYSTIAVVTQATDDPTTVDRFFTITRTIEDHSDKVYFRWVVGSNQSGEYDHYGIRNISITLRRASSLNSIILHRQGPYGWPSWKQLRSSDSSLGRYLKKNSIYSIPVDVNVPRFSSLGNYSWPGNIDHITATSDRVVRSAYQLVDPPVTENRYPFSLVTFSRNDNRYRFGSRNLPDFYDSQSGPTRANTPPLGNLGTLLASALGNFRRTKKSFTYSNENTRFANDNVTNALQATVDRDLAAKSVVKNEILEQDFSIAGSRLEYSQGIFPQEKNTFLKKTRQRTQFKTDDFWKQNRKDRIRTNQKNSQGYEIPRLSCWPLDEPENFKSSPIKKTTDYLGGDGSGELFANYSVFHNNLHHPSASALFARPFPVQATSSLPNGFKMYEFTLSSSYSRGMSFPNGFNSKASNSHEHKFRAANSINIISASHGYTFNSDNQRSLPPGWISAGYSGGAATTASISTTIIGNVHGPRVQGNDISSSPTHVGPILSMGPSIPKVDIYDPPGGGHSYFRWFRTTSSYDFPGKITFSLKTGNSTTVGDNYGIHKSSNPIFVQIGDEDQSRSDRGYRTVAKIGSTSTERDYYADEHIFRHVEILVTASLTDQKIRFLTAVSASGHNIDGQWAVNHVNVYSMNEVDREVLYDRNEQEIYVGDLLVPEMTASVVSDKSTRTLKIPNSKRKYFSSRDSSDLSSVSTVELFNYADHRSLIFPEAGGPNNLTAFGLSSQDLVEVTKFRFSENSSSYDFLISHSGSKIYQNIYAKDEKLDHHLYGSQFFKTPEQRRRSPFNFDGYDEFIEQARLKAKNYGVLPEFRISEHMDYYINTVGGSDPFFTCNDTFLSVTGANSPVDSSNISFYEIYSHSDFLKQFDVVTEELESLKEISPARLTLECKAFKKFLPYKGFYPADRMVQMASEFSSSYFEKVSGGTWRSFLAPYYAPGIAFNTIKSGLAVDYPVFEPHEDRIYNKYGVIFQTASIDLSKDGNLHDSEPCPIAELSKNRIEIGGGSEWGKALTGSIAGGNHSNKVAVSFWMYTPSSMKKGYETPALSQKPLSVAGTIISLGSGEIENYDEAPRKGLHFGYYIDSNATNGLASTNLAGAGTNLDFFTKFVITGGDGDNYFKIELNPSDNERFRRGWNHYYVELDIANIGNGGDANRGIQAYINGRKYNETATWTSYGVWGIGDRIKLEGHRNCFIGNHLGSVKAMNTVASSVSTIGGDFGDALRSGGSNAASDLEATLTCAPSICMMTEILVFNDSIPSQAIRALAGVNGDSDDESDLESNLPKGPDDSTGQKVNTTDFNSYAEVRHKNEKPQLGPRNPYTLLPRDKHKNLVAWYRPGNDTGYRYRKVDPALSQVNHCNGLPVYNHAADFLSGKTIISTGSVLSTIESTTDTGEKYAGKVPSVANFLSGTFYGFTEWTGSVDDDLKWSSEPRQRWNGIVDLSNPAQYTYTFHSNGTDSGQPNHTLDQTWYVLCRDFQAEHDNPKTDRKNEKILRERHQDNLTGSAFTFITGAYKMPSYVVGSRFNFTDDPSIPRIGSASYGTQYYTGSNSIGDEPFMSLGSIGHTQKQTGVRKVHRIPFEAIIDPQSFTPSMKSDGDEKVAFFYDMEPHPSASLLGYTAPKRRQMPDGATQWTGSFNLSNTVKNNKFERGVAVHSASLLAEFDLQSAANKKTIYTRAASNFYAECLNLFIANGKGVTIRTSDIPGEINDDFETYEANIIVGAGSDGLDNPMYNNPAAFGPPIDAGRLKRQTRDLLNLPRHKDLVGYGFAPYLPANYDGFATARLVFTPDPNIEYTTVEQIVADTKIYYSRDISASGSIESIGSGIVGDSVVSDVPASYNRRFAMQLSESFSGLSFENSVKSYDQNGEEISPVRRSFVIQTKFECPTFNFNTTARSELDQPRTDKNVQHLSPIKGVWHQTGSHNTNNRPFVSVVSAAQRFRNAGDLKQLIGLTLEGGATNQNIGDLPESRKIREGVIAIPFRTVLNSRKFFDLPSHEVYQAVRNLGYSDYKLRTDEEKREFRDLVSRFASTIDPVERGNREKIPVRDSIQSMVTSMMHYNIPPQFNFLKYNDPNGKFIKPFAMYIFDFSVNLEKDELAKIWQNVTPDIGLDSFGNRGGSRAPIAKARVSHDLFGTEDLLNPSADIITGINPATGERIGKKVRNWSGGLDEEVQWMVFKVKQKAQSDYFKKKQMDKYPDGHPEKVPSVENDIFNYGFNWPYDYFSLVELVNLKSTVSYELKSRELTDTEALILEVSKEDTE